MDLVVKGGLYYRFLRDYLGVNNSHDIVDHVVNPYLDYTIVKVWFKLEKIYIFHDDIITQILLNLDRMS